MISESDQPSPQTILESSKSPSTHEVSQPELSEEEISRAEKIIAYAKSLQDKGESFVWVYRTEGEHDPQLMYSAGGQPLRGSWFTPSWENAQRYYRERSQQDVPGLKVFALVLPQQFLDNRNPIDMGMNQVNVINLELQNGKKEVDIEQTSTPNATDYISQIELVKRYAYFKNKSIEALLIN